MEMVFASFQKWMQFSIHAISLNISLLLIIDGRLKLSKKTDC